MDAMSSTCACAQEGSKEWVRAHTFPRESSPHLPIFSPLGVYFLEILPSRDADVPPSPRLRLFTDSAVVQGLHRQPVRGGWVLPRPRLHRILARRAVSPARPQLQAQVRGRPVPMVPRRVAHGRHPEPARVPHDRRPAPIADVHRRVLHRNRHGHDIPVRLLHPAQQRRGELDHRGHEGPGRGVRSDRSRQQGRR